MMFWSEGHCILVPTSSWLPILISVLVPPVLYYLFYPAIVAARTHPNQLQHHQSVRVVVDEEQLRTSHPGGTTSETSESVSIPPNISASMECSSLQIDDRSNHRMIVLSLIIPAYNEELRLPSMLQDTYEYLTLQPCQGLQQLLKVAVRNHRLGDQSTSSMGMDPLSYSKSITPVVEWIVVDDGSTDATGKAFLQFAQSHCTVTTTPHDHNNSDRVAATVNSDPKSILCSTSPVQMEWKLITLLRNCGKGAAVQAGMLQSQGAFSLMVDADGATSFGPGLEAFTQQQQQQRRRQQQLRGERNWRLDPPSSHLRQDTPVDKPTTTIPKESSSEKSQFCGNDGDRIHAPCGVYLGSRAHKQVERSTLRRILAVAFQTLLQCIVGRRVAAIRDTQCGFKLFPQSTVQPIFTNLHLQRWAFDVEVIYLAVQLGYPLEEIVVPWHEVEGSKLHTTMFNLVCVAIGMLRDMICVRLCYVLGIWSIHTEGNTATRNTATSTNRR